MSKQHKDPLDSDFDEDFFKELDEIQLNAEPLSTQSVVPSTETQDIFEPELPQSEPVHDLPPTPAPKAKKSLFDFGKNTNADTAKQKSPKPAKPKSGLFASKAKSAQQMGALSKKPKPNNPNTLILLALLAIGVAIGAWFLLKPKATPEVDTQAIAPTTAPVAAEPVQDTQATAEQPTEVAPTELATTPEPSAAELPEVPLVDADQIINAQIPQSPELIKEEIDLLKDKDNQLTEQAKLINEQLKDLEGLTQAKQEQIDLLEKQIALLEEQKGK